VKIRRLLSRLLLLSLVAAAFVGLTWMYGRSAHPPFPSSRSQEEKRHRPSAPQFDYFLEFVGYGTVLAVFALAGRLVFRLRLNPVSRREGQPILLNLRQAR
jgi:hypothetical protein